MTLLITETDKCVNLISLIRKNDSVEVWIDDHYMAGYCDDGKVRIHGKHSASIYEGRWDV